MSKKQIKKITFVEFDLAQKHFLSSTIMPRTYGIVLIATILRNLGYDVKVYCEHIAPIDIKRVRQSDLICFSPLTAAANKTFALADFIRNNWNIPMVIGGTFATFFTDLCLEHFDYVIRNEGDETIVRFIESLKIGQGLESILGLSYRSSIGVNVHNPDCKGVRNFNVIPDLSLVEGYDQRSQWQLILTERRIRWIVLQSTRGCLFSCDYCTTPVMYGKGYRMRSIDSVIKDIKDKLQYGNNFLFMDNCFTANLKYTKEILRRVIDEGVKGSFTAFTRYEATEDDELMGLLKQTGFINLYVGAESLNDDVFIRMNKCQTVEKLQKAIKQVKKHNMMITLSFQAGNDEDDKWAVRRAVDFGLEHDVDGVYFISTWSWPESEKPVFNKQRMILKSLDYASGHFVTHFPLNMKPSTLQRSISEQQHRFWSLKRIPDFIRRNHWKGIIHLLVQGYALSMIEKPLQEYICYLEEIEQGYYDQNENLDLAKINTRKIDYKNEFNEKYYGRLVGKFKGT